MIHTYSGVLVHVMINVAMWMKQYEKSGEMK